MVKHCDSCKCDDNTKRKNGFLCFCICIGTLGYFIMSVLMIDYAHNNRFDEWGETRFKAFQGAMVVALICYASGMAMVSYKNISVLVQFLISALRLLSWKNIRSLRNSRRRRNDTPEVESGSSESFSPDIFPCEIYSEENPPPLPPKPQCILDQTPPPPQKVVAEIHGSTSPTDSTPERAEAASQSQYLPHSSMQTSPVKKQPPAKGSKGATRKKRFQEMMNASKLQQIDEIDLERIEIPFSVLVSEPELRRETVQETSFTSDPAQIEMHSQASNIKCRKQESSQQTPAKGYLPFSRVVSTAERTSNKETEMFVSSAPCTRSVGSKDARDQKLMTSKKGYSSHSRSEGAVGQDAPKTEENPSFLPTNYTSRRAYREKAEEIKSKYYSSRPPLEGAVGQDVTNTETIPSSRHGGFISAREYREGVEETKSKGYSSSARLEDAVGQDAPEADDIFSCLHDSFTLERPYEEEAEGTKSKAYSSRARLGGAASQDATKAEAIPSDRYGGFTSARAHLEGEAEEAKSERYPSSASLEGAISQDVPRAGMISTHHGGSLVTETEETIQYPDSGSLAFDSFFNQPLNFLDLSHIVPTFSAEEKGEEKEGK